jgi:hypothetical protein
MRKYVDEWKHLIVIQELMFEYEHGNLPGLYFDSERGGPD